MNRTGLDLFERRLLPGFCLRLIILPEWSFLLESPCFSRTIQPATLCQGVAECYFEVPFSVCACVRVCVCECVCVCACACACACVCVCVSGLVVESLQRMEQTHSQVCSDLTHTHTYTHTNTHTHTHKHPQTHVTARSMVAVTRFSACPGQFPCRSSLVIGCLSLTDGAVCTAGCCAWPGGLMPEPALGVH